MEIAAYLIVLVLLVAILFKLNKLENKIMVAIDDLIADVQDESTVVNGIIALLNSISAQLAAAGTDQVKLQQLKDLIDANKAKISAAVTANTPAAPAA